MGRYVIYGAGAIGSPIGALLTKHGHETILISRGAHLERMQQQGLTLRNPDGVETLKVRAVAHPTEIDFQDDDVVILTMKSQDTEAALTDLQRATEVDLPIVCAQNGVENERIAGRLFSRVYAMLLLMPATMLEPGHVIVHAAPVRGVLDAGRYPHGTDTLIERVCADLSASEFSARADARVMRLKYGKLLMNMINSADALCGVDGSTGDLVATMKAEAEACFRAAKIDYLPVADVIARRNEDLLVRQVEGYTRMGSSSWQSLERGTGNIEADHLNGEIVLMGRLHDVPTPANRAVQILANRAARQGWKPGAMSVEEVTAAIEKQRQIVG